jgi:two-component system phosphate regulon response regulator PhoB
MTEALILIIDDSEQMRTLLQLMLQRAGYRILVAESGEEALALLELDTPHLIITDLMMPRMSGLALCRAIRARPATHKVPILMRTNRLMDAAFLQDAYDAGATEVMHILVAQTTLLPRVRELLAPPPENPPPA